MSYSSHEVPGSRKGTQERITREYYVYDTTAAEDDVYAFAAALPEIMGGLPKADFSYEETDELENAYIVAVNWGVPQNDSGSQDIDTTEYKFNFQCPGGHYYQSLETISLTPDPALGPDEGGAAAADLFGGALNIVSDEGGYRVEGLNFSPPNESFTLSYKAPSTVITGAYQTIVEGLAGKVNSATFRGRPAGSLLLARVQGGRDTSQMWYIEFGFAYIANAEDIPVGDITVEAKDGWDLLWAFYGKRKDVSANGVVRKPVYALVERMFYRADFNDLDLPD